MAQLGLRVWGCTESGKAVLAISPASRKKKISYKCHVVEGEFDGLTLHSCRSNFQRCCKFEKGQYQPTRCLRQLQIKISLSTSKNRRESELALTDATDIIFYWGGDLRVTNFELGKDLVWFLFSRTS